MSLDFLVWLVVFFIQLGLLGITMYIVRRSSCSSYASAHCCVASSPACLCSVMTICACVQLITLSDLEADYLNPHDSSIIVNYWLVSA